MSKIVTIDQVERSIPEINQKDKKVVVVGGCFDIVHVGHISFLHAAKAQGDVLVVLLESDEAIRKQKGAKRPIHTQSDRAVVLSELRMVDYVVLLRSDMTDKDYDALLSQLKPAIIATTKGDRNRHHKERQAANLHSQLVDVIEYLPSYSTTKVVDANEL